MKILRTHQISAAIIDIIDDSKEYCFLVSPYIRTWALLDRALSKAARTKRRLTFIVRNDSETIARITDLHNKYEFEFIALDNLHAKLYCNEKRALITSMNLFDISQERNLELGLLLESESEARLLLKEVILGELLETPVRLHLKGYFSSDDKVVASEMKAFESKIAERGYCVICGSKMELDISDVKPWKKTVRCKACYYRMRYEPDLSSVRIHHCHFCGQKNETNLLAPFHEPCLEIVTRYANWVNMGRRGDSS